MRYVRTLRTLNVETMNLISERLLAYGRLRLFAIGIIGLGLLGCSGRPSDFVPPELDPESAAAEAIALYDKDGDGKLSKTELKACPGLLVSIGAYDKDGDEVISEDEIAQRLQKYVSEVVTLSRLSATVRLDNRPLVGATVRFIPETYLGEEIKESTGVTNKGGSASMAVADEELPENQKGIRGIHPGTYRVEITDPEGKVPAMFNTETTLGYETTPSSQYTSFDLKSRKKKKR